MTGNPDERLFASSCVSDLVSALPEYQQFRERTPTQGALIRKHWRKQNVMNEQLVKQYQAKVFTGTGETSIESVVLGEVKQEISNLLDSSAGEVHYEQPNPRTTLVFDRKAGRWSAASAKSICRKACRSSKPRNGDSPRLDRKRLNRDTGQGMVRGEMPRQA